jgi:hypothetical protein
MIENNLHYLKQNKLTVLKENNFLQIDMIKCYVKTLILQFRARGLRFEPSYFLSEIQHNLLKFQI